MAAGIFALVLFRRFWLSDENAHASVFLKLVSQPFESLPGNAMLQLSDSREVIPSAQRLDALFVLHAERTKSTCVL